MKDPEGLLLAFGPGRDYSFAWIEMVALELVVDPETAACESPVVPKDSVEIAAVRMDKRTDISFYTPFVSKELNEHIVYYAKMSYYGTES
ncbi:hypothetical protein [Sporosarcina sp. FA9]|uniref:hypothetical protein n=1 Tax=Sporosarcina sp. FA9 TaxID=3413030 RepID=UPI003F654F09